MIALVDGCIHSVTTFDIVDGYIQSVYTVRNPEKLKRLNERLSINFNRASVIYNLVIETKLIVIDLDKNNSPLIFRLHRFWSDGANWKTFSLLISGNPL